MEHIGDVEASEWIMVEELDRKRVREVEGKDGG